MLLVITHLPLASTSRVRFVLLATLLQTGVDNMVMCAWDSFHLLDVNIVQKIAASDIEYPLREFMNKHGATNSQLSLDIKSLNT